jgi:putative hydrolase of the HAD superfamily
LNIVFDLGGVVFRWKPEAIISSAFEDENTQGFVRKEIFEHSDWIELDRGTISLEAAIDRGARRTGLPARDIARLLNAVPRFLTPIDKTIDLICRLSDTGNKLFVLSNMHRASITYLEQQHDIWEMFHGVVISSRINTVKPEIEIYQHLLDKYQIRPAETILIDDAQENLTAASSLGIQTIRFSDSNQCERALVDRQCL